LYCKEIEKCYGHKLEEGPVPCCKTRAKSEGFIWPDPLVNLVRWEKTLWTLLNFIMIFVFTSVVLKHRSVNCCKFLKVNYNLLGLSFCLEYCSKILPWCITLIMFLTVWPVDGIWWVCPETHDLSYCCKFLWFLQLYY
jgi:hypothetical protein